MTGKRWGTEGDRLTATFVGESTIRSDCTAQQKMASSQKQIKVLSNLALKKQERLDTDERRYVLPNRQNRLKLL